jgi:hypothetical protein
MSVYLPTALAAWVHRAEGEHLTEVQIPNMDVSLILRVGTRRLTFSRKEGEGLRPDKVKVREVHRDYASVYIENVDLTFLKLNCGAFERR